MPDLGLVALFVGLPLYYGVMYWLSNVAKRDMERRGQSGWVFGSFLLWPSPMGLLSWWEARRRYPVLDQPVPVPLDSPDGGERSSGLRSSSSKRAVSG